MHRWHYFCPWFPDPFNLTCQVFDSGFYSVWSYSFFRSTAFFSNSRKHQISPLSLSWTAHAAAFQTSPQFFSSSSFSYWFGVSISSFIFGISISFFLFHAVSTNVPCSGWCRHWYFFLQYLWRPQHQCVHALLLFLVSTDGLCWTWDEERHGCRLIVYWSYDPIQQAHSLSSLKSPNVLK